jgi:hypothetical protein
MLAASVVCMLVTAAAAAEPPRVFRAVLDGRPRAVVVDLGSGFWLSWDAERCAPTKVWHGAVRLVGAVYDTQHGPTPRSEGQTLWLSREPVAWRLDGAEAAPRFDGYTLRDHTVELRCRLRGTDGRELLIREVPGIEREPDGRVRFVRRLHASGAGLAVVVDGFGFGEELALELDGEVLAASPKPVDLGWGAVEQLRVPVPLPEGESLLGLAVRPGSPPDGSDAVVLSDAGGTILANLAVDPAVEVESALAWSAWRDAAVPFGPAGSAYGPFDLRIATPSVPEPRPLVRAWLGEATENLQAGPVGMAIRVGPEPVTVFALGRPVLPGNRGLAVLTLRSADGDELGRAVLDLSEPTAPGSFRYAELPEPVVLPADSVVHVQGEQHFGGNVLFAPGLTGPAPGAADRLASAGGDVHRIDVAGEPVDVEPGLWLQAFELPRPPFGFDELVPGQLPNTSRVAAPVALDEETEALEPPLLVTARGFVVVPEGGAELVVEGSGALRLEVDGRVVDEGRGGEASSPPLEAGAREVAITLLSEEAPTLALVWRRGGVSQEVPAEALFTRAHLVRITAPGTKRVKALGWDLSTLQPIDLAALVYFVVMDRWSWFQREVLGEATDDGQSIVYDVGGKLEGVHPAFDVSDLRPEGFHPKVGGLAHLPDGRLVVSLWEPEGGVYVVEEAEAAGGAPRRIVRIAEGLLEPLGLAVVDDRLFVLQKPELTELLDDDGDGRIDTYRSVSAEWGVTQNFHEFAFGLAERDGALHGTLATAINPGGPSSPNQHLDRGRVFRVGLDGSGFRFLAAGLRTPNGIGLGPAGGDGATPGLYVADNQGDWLPASKIVRVEEGAFFGNRSVDPAGTQGRTDTPPVFWLPQFEIGNSPSQVGHFPGPPFEGQLLWGDVTHGGLKRGFVERVGGVEQGAVFRFTQGLDAGINRFSWAPDGSLVVGGIGSTGNWSQFGKAWYGLQRLTPNGEPSFEPRALRLLADGFEVELTEPADPASLPGPEAFEAAHWRYEPTAAYGGPKVDEASLVVAAVELSEDARRIRVRIDGLEEGRVVYLRLPEALRSEAGRELWTGEAWYTLNRLPR